MKPTRRHPALSANALDFEPPGVVVRAVAYLLDLVPIVLLLWVTAYLSWPDFRHAVDVRLGGDGSAEARASFLAYRNVVREGSIALYLGYAHLAETWAGGTLGKRVLGLVVVDSAGNPPGAGRVLVRTLTKVLSVYMCIGVLTSFVDPERRMLHDLIAGTKVVRRGGLAE